MGEYREDSISAFRKAEDDIWNLIQERGETLREEISDDARRHLGSVSVEVEWRRGTIVIEVVLGLMAAATAYKNIIELLTWYRDHLAERVVPFFDLVEPSLNGSVIVSGSMVPGPAALTTLSGQQTPTATPGERLTFYRYAFGFGLATLAVGLTAFLFWLFFG